ncbi:hypothetical protein RJ639_015059 [Escallonia herrerae]|uniref:GDSL esterase/lipase n=1 Tax=Escallonia herrerae TaxID=1293975 RepID=A0AA88VGS3_9ASTE|nr:hypothetical protein RJ639_015059 [Escallonia herrerae]
MVYVDAFSLPLELTNSPTKYGFEVANKGCCGTAVVEVAFLCTYTCTDVSDYVFWDGFHLTEKAYRVLVDQFLKKDLNSFLF